MITFGQEKFKDIQKDLEILVKDHWDEIALHKDKIPLDPDWERYAQCCQDGRMVFITVRDKGILVGYSIWLISNHLHYKSTKWAYNDVVFLKKDYRKKGFGLDLIKFSENTMKYLGCHKVQWHIKITQDWSDVLKNLGYEVEDIVLGKYVWEQ